MPQYFLDLLGSSGHNVEIKTYEGPPVRGRLSVHREVPSSPRNADYATRRQADLPALEFTSADGVAFTLDWDRVKAIDLLASLEEDSEPEVRFFDSAEVLPYLWVRLTLKDGDALEGKLANSLHTVCSPYLLLYPLDESANRKCVCVPRSSIDTMQVVTLRQ